MMQLFNGKTFIVAGAGGIGAATARKISELGGKIILMDVNDEAMSNSGAGGIFRG